MHHKLVTSFFKKFSVLNVDMKIIVNASIRVINSKESKPKQTKDQMNHLPIRNTIEATCKNQCVRKKELTLQLHQENSFGSIP